MRRLGTKKPGVGGAPSFEIRLRLGNSTGLFHGWERFPSTPAGLDLDGRARTPFPSYSLRRAVLQFARASRRMASFPIISRRLNELGAPWMPSGAISDLRVESLRRSFCSTSPTGIDGRKEGRRQSLLDCGLYLVLVAQVTRASPMDWLGARGKGSAAVA